MTLYLTDDSLLFQLIVLFFLLMLFCPRRICFCFIVPYILWTGFDFIYPAVLKLHVAVIARPLAYSLSSRVDKNFQQILLFLLFLFRNIPSITIMNRNPDITRSVSLSHSCLNFEPVGSITRLVISYFWNPALL